MPDIPGIDFFSFFPMTPSVFSQGILGKYAGYHGNFCGCLKNEMFSRMGVLFFKHPSIRRGQNNMPSNCTQKLGACLLCEGNSFSQRSYQNKGPCAMELRQA